PQLLSSILEEAIEITSCPAKCKSSCENCLLSHDLRLVENYLDRRVAELFLRNFSDRLEIPVDKQILGTLSKLCLNDLKTELILSSKSFSSKLYLFISGNHIDFAPLSPGFKHFIENLPMKSVELVFPDYLLEKLSNDQKLDLLALSKTFSNMTLMQSYEGQPEGVLAVLESESGDRRVYATDCLSMAELNDSWGLLSIDSLLLYSDEFEVNFQHKKIVIDAFNKASNGLAEIAISNHLNGPVKSFGIRFWKLVLNASKDQNLGIESSQLVTKVVYSDRYLATPFVLNLMKEVLFTLPFELNPTCSLEITTKKPDSSSYDETIISNWRSHDELSKLDLLKELYGFKFSSVLINQLRQNKELGHSRVLEIHFAEGKVLIIRLDQGFGYWILNGRSANFHFPFSGSTESQLKVLNEVSSKDSVKNYQEQPTYIYLSIK
ncbi:MAG: DEAD/DEAH box helicase domain-containing protein, partial [Roseivirga sp.]